MPSLRSDIVVSRGEQGTHRELAPTPGDSAAGKERDGPLELPVLLGSSGFGGQGSPAGPSRPEGTGNTRTWLTEELAEHGYDGFGESGKRRCIWDWVCFQGKRSWSSLVFPGTGHRVTSRELFDLLPLPS